MTKKIRVNVTQQDIEQGWRGSSQACPVARALRRQDELRRWWVGPDYIISELGSREANLPPEARVFISAFDHGYPVAPFSFDLEVP
jgi:hypothetical protein